VRDTFYGQMHLVRKPTKKYHVPMKMLVFAFIFSINAYAIDHTSFFENYKGCWETLEWNGQPAPTNHSRDPRFKQFVITPFARYITDINGSDVPTLQGFLFQKIGPTPIPGTIGPHYDYVAVFLDRGTVTPLSADSFSYQFNGQLKDRTTGVDFEMMLSSTWTLENPDTLHIIDSRQIPEGDPGLSRETEYKLLRTTCSDAL